MTSHHDIIQRDVIKKIMARWPTITETFNEKYTRLSPSIYTFSGLIFQKPFTCVRNNIILYMCYILKCNENWWKAAYHASSIQRSSGVWCQAYEFCTIIPGILITGDFKIFVQNKIFSRPTDPTFWAVCNRNQTIIFVPPYVLRVTHSRSPQVYCTHTN